MRKYDDIKTRLDKLESYVYEEIPKLIQDNLNSNDTDKKENVNSNLLKYRPSKRRKAYKIERNFKKRCYTR